MIVMNDEPDIYLQVKWWYFLEILVSAYGLFRDKPPRFAPASLAAGARGWKTRAAAETTLRKKG